MLIFYIDKTLNNRYELIIKIIIADIFDEYFEKTLVLFIDFSFKNTVIKTIKINVVNIHNHNEIISGTINVNFHKLSKRKYILQAKLQGANHDRKAINNVFF